MKIKDIIDIYENAAPIALSFSAQKNVGAYDNSGLLIDGGESETPCVICALDLCDGMVNLAIEKGAKLILTHHPVIYRAIKKIDGLYAKVIKNNITVYSSHLNLDSADGGIEDRLAKICGEKNNAAINEYIDEKHGFGRIFEVAEEAAESVVNRVIGGLSTKKYIFYGDKNMPVKRVGSFCGAGLNEAAANMADNCDLYISSDMQHHVILSLLERGKCVLQLTHYASEVTPMRLFIENLFKDKGVDYYFYIDERFM